VVSQDGSVLLCALMVIALIATAGVALSMIVVTESAVAANYVGSQQGLFAAEAGIERAIADLRASPAWGAVTATSVVSLATDFNDGQATPRGPDRTTLDLAQLTIKRQAESDAVYPASSNRPVWHVYGHASLDRMIPGAGASAPYVVVWVADDVDDGDGNAAVDTNDVVMVHAEAFGIRGGKRAVNVTIQREQAMAAGLPGVMRSDVRIVAWHEVH
jgi:hypothetical protein